MIITFEHINLSFYFLLSNIVNVFMHILHCTFTIDIETIHVSLSPSLPLSKQPT